LIMKEEIKSFKKIEIIERPADEEQFDEDIRNSGKNQLKDRDTFKRWAVYLEKGVLKVCFYPYGIKNEDSGYFEKR